MSQEFYNLGEEHEQLEHKKSTGELKEGVVSVASILNKHGSGDLFYGVKNNGDVIGQKIGESTLRDVSRAIREAITPAVYPTITKETYGGRDIIHVHFAGDQRPYLAYKVPYIRIADEDITMDQETYRKMLNARADRTDSWETKPSKYTVSDVDQTVFKDYLSKAKETGRVSFPSDDISAVLSHMGVLDGDRLLNAGAALFVNCPLNELQLAKFASDEKLTMTDINRFTGSILQLAKIAERYLIDAMDWRVVFDGGLERKEIPEIPVKALREAIINAFAHREIESGQSVSITVFKSFIEIFSPGAFPQGVTPEAFINQNLTPYRRNRIITRILYYSRDMETFATGLKRIHDECTALGVKYEFLNQPFGFVVRFYRHCGDGWNSPSDQSLNQSLIGKGTKKGTNDNRRKHDIIEARLDAVLKLIRDNNSITQSDLANKLNISLKQVKDATDLLKAKGAIHRVGSSRSGHWVVDHE